MFLKKFIYVNWGNIPATEFEFGPINLLSGGNGSGKTTAADAIQTIMTAAHDTLFNYNPGQDEATQRGRGKNVRTLASYVLGCDDGSYARPDGAVGYLAAVFHPTGNEPGEAFTAVVGVSASLDKAGSQPIARQNDIQFYIVAGEQLTLSDFLQDDLDGNRLVVPLNRLKQWLGNRLTGGKDSATTLNIEQYDTKKQYLRRLYGALRGRFDAVGEREAINAARTFSRFMAYKPVKSINGFVANEILEARDLGDAIRSVSDLMKTIHAMEAESKSLAATIERLNRGRVSASRYIDQWLEHQVLTYTAVKSRFLADQRDYLSAKQQQQQLGSRLQEAEQERELAQERRRALREQLIAMEARRLGICALQDKDAAEQAIAMHRRALQQQALPLLEQDQQLQTGFKATGQVYSAMQRSSISVDVPSLAERSLMGQARAVLALNDDSSIDLQRLLGKDWIDLSPLEQHLDRARERQRLVNDWRQRFLDESLERSGQSIRDQVSRLADRREQKLQQLQHRISQKQADIDSLETRQLNYPGFVRQALELIRRECPQADPRVLADYVEVSDSQWQSAIEGYIGGARFSIIVEREFEAEAAQLVRSIPGGSRARVVQGEKARKDCERLTLPSNSIIQLMTFEHATAKAYLQASYGMVEQVPDSEALRRTRRGVTREGLGSGAYSIYRCDLDDAELVFGVGARDRALAAKQQELTGLLDQANEAQASWQESLQLLDAINLLRPVSFADLMKEMVDTHYQLQQAEQLLERVDLTDFADVETEFEQLQQKAEAQDVRIRDLDGSLGRLTQQLKDSEATCKSLSARQEVTSDQAERAEVALRRVSALWPEMDVEQVLEQADSDAGRVLVDGIEAQARELLQQLNGSAYDVERQIAEHNLNCQTLDAIVYNPDYRQEHSDGFFKSLCELLREIDRIHNRLKNNILVAKQQQLSTLRESFNNAFVSNLCHSIYQSINDGKRVLEDLNKELAHHRFGADQECYWFDWEWVPEYKAYWQFFEEVIKNPTLGEGATLFDADLPKSALRVRDQLMAMLLDDDEQHAMRELERISDYRNYRSYEIYKQPANKEPIALSQYGTGSGGQLETPAYIIRSAAITSAFRFNDGDTHLRMVLVDEAFSKMDETRSKEVINYLTESLGLQLLFIMPTSKSGPFMDMISNQFVFSKIPLMAGQRAGQLQTRVLVDRQQCHQQRVKELWANHRKTIRHQAGLDFMAGFSD
ncbi:ATP-binding protein [Oceanobacter antarcticus]|uniref:SbcC/MukB-like Walker B domain-containing protein n=1 Tax=Oceanobacter antarcticus TaxID=3133425 RepID=A0ABW8NP50_9GAMM